MAQLNLITILLSLAFLVNLGLGLLVYLKDSPHSKISLSFSALSWASAGWVFSVLMIYFFKEDLLRLFSVRMSFLSSSIIPSAFLYFSLVFPKEKRFVGKNKLLLICFPPLIFVALSFTKFMVHSVQWEIIAASYGIAYPFFAIYLVIFLFGGLYFLIRNYKYSIGINRLQIKYCFLGMLFTSTFAIIANLILPILGTSKYSAIGPSFTMIMVGFTTYSIVKHRLMDINIVLRKGTTYFLLMLLLFIPSLLLIILSQKFFFKEINYLFSAIILFLLFLVAFFFHKVKPGTEKAVEQILFKNRYDYRETLGRFTKALVTILDLQSLSKKIIDTITQTMGVEKASLFLLNEEKGEYYLYRIKEYRNSPPCIPPSPRGIPYPIF